MSLDRFKEFLYLRLLRHLQNKIFLCFQGRLILLDLKHYYIFQQHPMIHDVDGCQFILEIPILNGKIIIFFNPNE